MRIPILSKLNDKINIMTNDLNSLGDQLVDILDKANTNISTSLSKSTEDIRKTSDSIVKSTDTINESLKSATEDIRGTAESISTSADSIAHAVEDFTHSTSATITQFESAIEKSVDKLVATIEDFKKEIVHSGVKVNLAGSAVSLMPRPPEGGIVQGITSGIRDMILPKRKPKDEIESEKG